MPTVAADLIAPTFESCPPSSWSLGPSATSLCASAGLVLDPWEAMVVDRVLAENDDRTPAAFEVGLIVPRQNGKGSVLEALSLAWLFLTDSPLILHSAHEFKTAAEAFRRLRTLIQGSPLLWRRVARVTTAAGNEAIELVSGQRLRYVARSKASGRGFTGGKLILDEAYAIEAEEMAALLPTLATQPEAQLVYTSSAGMAESDHLRRVRDRGRAGGDPTLCYLEWGGVGACPDGCKHRLDDPVCALNDRELWRRANPGIGIRITEGFIEKERRALGPDEFGRERLGWWDEPDTAKTSPITDSMWASRADPESIIAGPIVIAVDIPPSRTAAAVGVAGYRADGRTHLELARADSSTDWVVAQVAKMAAEHDLHEMPDGKVFRPAIVGDRLALGPLMPDFEAIGITPILLDTADQVEACGRLLDAVSNDTMRHPGQPELAEALAAAVKRDVGDGGWAWGKRLSAAGSVDISGLVAVTEAHWALSSLPPQPFFASRR